LARANRPFSFIQEKEDPPTRMKTNEVWDEVFSNFSTAWEDAVLRQGERTCQPTKR
jgi:hypothetical protein